MNWDRIEGNWKQFTGKVKEEWGDLTDDDVAKANGNREQLAGRIQEPKTKPSARLTSSHRSTDFGRVNE